MFIYGNIEQVNHEQHKDRLRRAEREQLIRQVEVANSTPGLWQQAGSVILNVIHRIKPTAYNQQTGAQPRLKKKIA